MLHYLKMTRDTFVLPSSIIPDAGDDHRNLTCSHIPKVGIVPRSARSDRNSDVGACDEVKLRLTTHHKQPQVLRPPATVMSGGWNTIESDAVRSLSDSTPSITNVHRASSHI